MIDIQPYSFYVPELYVPINSGEQSMSNNVETLRRCHNAFSTRNLDEAQKLVAENIRLTDHGRGLSVSSRNEFRGWMESFFSTASDMRIVDARYIDAGEWVIAQFRAIGKQDGPLVVFPPSGQAFSLDVCELWRFNADGEAVEGHNYSDGLGLLMQLGHIQPVAAETT
jgi:ketosteroid isomerase-like protein